MVLLVICQLSSDVIGYVDSCNWCISISRLSESNKRLLLVKEPVFQSFSRSQFLLDLVNKLFVRTLR